MDIKTYDARKVNVDVGGISLTGFGEDTMVECSQDDDTMSAKNDAKGNVGITINNKTMGTIKVTLMQTSPSVNYLDKLAKSRKIFPIWVTSKNEIKEVVGGTKAFVTKPADKSFGAEVDERQFEIRVTDYTVE
ncbi:phage structural protein [Rummeliibacillus stabekisii]|uniref:phage structural protein n=1 Tax=Rummeliibacillus stabekisii TaxID=241244 RepID=UPI003722FC69